MFFRDNIQSRVDVGFVYIPFIYMLQRAFMYQACSRHGQFINFRQPGFFSLYQQRALSCFEMCVGTNFYHWHHVEHFWSPECIDNVSAGSRYLVLKGFGLVCDMAQPRGQDAGQVYQTIK